ncbi:MAG: manganese efflux pump, partial [Acidaminococcaceae bacterium]
MDILTLLVLAVGVSMDAFAVSVCGSMSLRTEERVAGAVRFGLWFGGFQALMPVLGFFAAAQFRENISDYDHWIAFALLVYIGCKMIREAQESCALPKSS